MDGQNPQIERKAMVRVYSMQVVRLDRFLLEKLGREPIKSRQVRQEVQEQVSKDPCLLLTS